VALGLSEAFSARNEQAERPYWGALALLAAAVAIPLVIFWLPGGGRLDQARLALAMKRSFHVFISSACFLGAAALARFTARCTGGKKNGWETLFLAFIALNGVLYLLMAFRVNEEAWRQASAWHAAAGAMLLLAAAFKGAQFFSGRRALGFCWAGLLLVTGAQLLFYREAASAFSVKTITIQATSGPAPAAAVPAAPHGKNAATADKERSRH
jgi:hypothetical protein